MTLALTLDCTDARVLVVGNDPALDQAIGALCAAGARLIRLSFTDGDEQYSRRHLTPRPLIIVLGSADQDLSRRVLSDARERGILLVDVLQPMSESGHAKLSHSESL